MMADSGLFWARRKAAVKAEAEAEAADARASLDAREAEARARELATKTETEVLEELGLPNPDSLVQGDDFSAFMARAVPEHLRRRALRKLWVSNPVLANLDGLLDHGEDYTDAATVLPGMQTAYQVGKGMLHHVMALAEASAAKAEAEVADIVPEPEVEMQSETEPAKADIVPEPTVWAAAVGEVSPRSHRHMRFEFAGCEDRE